MDQLKLFYNTVLCQTKSNDGKYLFVGNIFGNIFVFSIEQICYDPEDEEEQTKIRLNTTEPIQIFDICDGGKTKEVQSLSFYKAILLVGMNGAVRGYQFNDKSHRIEKLLFEIKMPTSSGSYDIPDVNSLYLNVIDETLFAGCGDNKAYAISLDGAKIKRQFIGHKNFIHCVTGRESTFVSASEDGSVKLWDFRAKPAMNTLEPYKNEDLYRPNFGKWQGTVSINEDWLACGGGPKLSLWHLRSLECTTVFSFSGKIHTSDFLYDTVMVGGEHDKFYQYDFSGDVKSEIAISSTCVYSILWQQSPHQLLTIAGSSNKIDICRNFSFCDVTLRLYKNTWKV